MVNHPSLGRQTEPSKKEYSAWLDELLETFPQQDNPDVVYPPETYAKVEAAGKGAPALNRDLQRELFTMMMESERNSWEVNGKEVYPSQRGHLFWGASALTQGKKSPSSLLLKGPAGSGKTLELGCLLQAGVRLQLRGQLKGVITFCTAKPYHMTSKTVGRDYALKQMMKAPPDVPPEMHIRALYRSLVRMFPDTMEKYFSVADLKGYFDQRSGDFDEEREKLKKILGILSDDEMLDAMAVLLSGTGTLVAGLDEDAAPEILRFDLSGENDDESAVAYAGDAAFGIPPDYPVYTQKSWHALSERNGEAPLVLLTTSNAFVNMNMRKGMEGVLRKVDMILCDEARRTSETTFQTPIRQAGKSSNPLVIGATNIRYDNRWGADSPEQSLRQAIGVSLPNLRVNLFPGADGEHYPSESEEAVSQLLKAHFAKIPLLKKPPSEMNALLVVHSKLVGMIGSRLREIYDDMRGMKAEIHRYDAKSGDASLAGISQKALLEAWFVRERKEGPNILVTTPSTAADALDLPNIENLTIGTRASPDVLYRLLGRALHNNKHLAEGKFYGVYVAQQQFANSPLGTTPFGIVDHGLPLDEKTGFDWTPGQILLSQEHHSREISRVLKKKKYKKSRVPGTSFRRGTDDFITAEGTMLVGSDRAALHPPLRSVRQPQAEESYYLDTYLPNEDTLTDFLAQIDASDLIFTEKKSLLAAASIARFANRSWTKAVIAKVAEIRRRIAGSS